MIRILIIGNGSREYVVFKKLVDCEVFFVPCATNIMLENTLNIEPHEFEKIESFVREMNIEFVFIGPEYPLSLGIVNYLRSKFRYGTKPFVEIFGPTAEQARLETDKIWCREFVSRINHNMSPKFMVIETLDQLYDNQKQTALVFKPSGLTSGKGVRVFDNCNEIIFEELKSYLLTEKKPFLIEERLYGEEFSLIYMRSDSSEKFFPPVQDYKRLNKDSNVNTGGMGAISGFLTFLNEDILNECKVFMKRVIDEIEFLTLCKYNGFLYGSFMVTSSGPKLIEFNVRLGDPEAINIASYVEKIDPKEKTVHFKKTIPSITRYFVTSEYPKRIKQKYHLELPFRKKEIMENLVFSNIEKNSIGILTTGSSRTMALNYSGYIDEIIPKINRDCRKIVELNPFLRYREDIGVRDLSYKDSGVDVEKNEEVVQRISELVKRTFSNDVLSNFGDFGGIIRINKDVNLIASIDGVGTKTDFLLKAAEYLRIPKTKAYEMMGTDLICHSINDIAVKGARPLFFLDYVASSSIDQECVASFIKGLSDVCIEHGISLLGGETAEMPGIYTNGSVDMAGAIIGSLLDDEIIDGKRDIKEGDVAVALPSSGLHTNGYSLIRRMITEYGGFQNFSPEFISALMCSHKSYMTEINYLRLNKVRIKGLCHITGGGLTHNLPRVLPEGLYVDFDEKKLLKEGIFGTIQQLCNLDNEEMLKTFNCGIGMVLLVSPEDVNNIKKNSFILGTVKVKKKKERKE